MIIPTPNPKALKSVWHSDTYTEGQQAAERQLQKQVLVSSPPTPPHPRSVITWVTVPFDHWT